MNDQPHAPRETSDDDESLDDLWVTIEQNMGVCPSFFKLASADPEIARGLFDLAKFAYLDSAIPPLFAEKLFTFLSRFCPARYCVTRHAAFLLGRGYIAGDATSPALTAEAVLDIVAAPLPPDDKLPELLLELQQHDPLADWPDYDSRPGELLRVASTQVFLQPARSVQWSSALRKVVGPRRYEQLMLFLAFVRTAHFWTEVHPELKLERDIDALLAEHESLSRPLLMDCGDAAENRMASQLHQELVELRETKEMAAALQEREQLLRLATDVAGVGIITIDYTRQTARLDQAAAELFGLPTGKSIPRMDIHARFHKEDCEKLKCGIERALSATSDGNFAIDHRIVLPDDSVRWVSIRKRVKFKTTESVRAPESSVVITLDITDRKTSEVELRRSERRFRGTFENAAVGITHVALDGRWLRANDRFCEIVGYSRDEVQQMTFQKMTHPDDLAADLAQKQRLLANEIDHYSLEKRYLKKSGDPIWINLTVSLVKDSVGNPEYFIAIIEAIGDRKEAEARERQLMADAVALNAKFQATFRQSSSFAGMMTTDGTLVDVNSLALDMCGYVADDVLGRPFWECDWWRGLDEVQEKLRDATVKAAAGESYREELPYRWADNSMHVTDFALHPIRDDEGNVIFLYPTGMDITDRKEFEESLRLARDVAESANRSRGEFLANMSHEIRTPMTAILGHADILGDHLRDPDNLQCVETIRNNGKFLLNIINDILDLSKIDAGRLEIETERISPEALVAEIHDLMTVRAQQDGVQLHFEFDGMIPKLVETDAVRLRQILINLIGNAIKFTDEKGMVRVVVKYIPDCRDLRFDVIDSGIGIRERDLQKLFQPFTQADASTTREFGGTGLGLAISERLARALDGKIEVHSKWGEGSTFTLTISCGELSGVDLVQAVLTPEAGELVVNKDFRIDGRILVVDDRRDILHLAQHFIEKAGGRVVVASNGEEALDTIAASQSAGDRIDLVLMDMQMPVMDGYTAAKRLRQNGFRRPIIALTANAMKDDRDKCLEAGCDDYATKPLDGVALVRIVADYLSRDSSG